MKRYLFAACALFALPACQQSDANQACVPAGCNNELCVSASEASRVTTSCAYKPEHVCYATQGECKVQADNKCGWTQTAALKRCLKNPRAFMEK